MKNFVKNYQVVVAFLAIVMVLNLLLSENLNSDQHLEHLNKLRQSDKDQQQNMITFLNEQNDFLITKRNNVKETLSEKINNAKMHSEIVKNFSTQSFGVRSTHVISFSSKIVKNKNLKINLRRSKYLLPILFGGPNNQLVGFRESIYIAIQLNRTLVLPMFRKHRTDT